MLGALLALGLYAYNQEQREALLLLQRGTRRRDRCWRRWRHGHRAIYELRARNGQLEEARQTIWRRTCAILLAAALRGWLAEVQGVRLQRLGATLDRRWQQRVAAHSLWSWRRRAAWWSDSFVLKSYRDPATLARWSHLRVSSALLLLRPAFCGFVKYAAQTKHAGREAAAMARRVRSASSLCGHAFSSWVRLLHALPSPHASVGNGPDALKKPTSGRARAHASTSSHADALQAARGRLVRWVPTEGHPFRFYPASAEVLAPASIDNDSAVAESDEAEPLVCFAESDEAEPLVCFDDSRILTPECFPVRSRVAADDAAEETPRVAPPRAHCQERRPGQRWRKEDANLVPATPVSPATPPCRPLLEISILSSTPNSALSKAETIERPRAREMSDPAFKNELLSDCTAPEGDASVRTCNWQAAASGKHLGQPRQALSGIAASQGATLFADLRSSAGIGVLLSGVGLAQVMRNANVRGVVNPFTREALSEYYPTTMLLDEFLRLPASDSFLQRPLLIKALPPGAPAPAREHLSPLTLAAPARHQRAPAATKTESFAVVDGAAALAHIGRLAPHSLRCSLPARELEDSGGVGSEGRSAGEEYPRPCFLIQKYIDNPLLIHGYVETCRQQLDDENARAAADEPLPCRRRFQLHVFVLVARVNPLLCFYHDGFLTLDDKMYAPPWAGLPREDETVEAPGHILPLEGVSTTPVWTFDQVRLFASHGLKLPLKADRLRFPDASVGHGQLREHLSSICRSPCARTSVQRDALEQCATVKNTDILEERVKPHIKGALRHALVSVLGARQSAEQPGPKLPEACSDSVNKGIKGPSLMAADFLLDHHLDVHLLGFCADPILPVSPCKVIPHWRAVQRVVSRLGSGRKCCAIIQMSAG